MVQTQNNHNRKKIVIIKSNHMNLGCKDPYIKKNKQNIGEGNHITKKS